jgi:hypothetical protein
MHAAVWTQERKGKGLKLRWNNADDVNGQKTN